MAFGLPFTPREHASEMRLLKRGETPPRFRRLLVAVSTLCVFWLAIGIFLLFMLTARGVPSQRGLRIWYWATILAAMAAPAPTFLLVCLAVWAPRKYYNIIHYVLRRHSRSRRIRLGRVASGAVTRPLVSWLNQINTQKSLLLGIYIARALVVAGTAGTALLSMSALGSAVCAALPTAPWCGWLARYTISTANVVWILSGMMTGIVISAVGAWCMQILNAAHVTDVCR